jgi:hypothetical protein
MDFGYTRLRSILYGKYHDNTWLIQSLIYMVSRYHPLEDRLIETFRYVECDRDNSYAFSYEFGSILRDVGSTFGSVLDTLVRNSENRSPNERLDISDYRTWLKTEIDSIYLITAGITTPRAGRYVIPFSSWESSESRLQWWDSYNNVKHLDIEKYPEGNFKNCIISLAALAILYTLIDSESRNGNRIRLFGEIGYVVPEETRKSLLFFKNS